MAADKLTAAGVRPTFNMIFGYPGEAEKERRESIAAHHEHLPAAIPAPSSGPTFSLRIPASPIMQRAFELGIEVPKTLEGWVGFLPASTRSCRGSKGREHKRVQTMREYMRVAFRPRAYRQASGTGARARLAVLVDQRAGALAPGSSISIAFPVGSSASGQRKKRPKRLG